MTWIILTLAWCAVCAFGLIVALSLYGHRNQGYVVMATLLVFTLGGLLLLVLKTKK